MKNWLAGFVISLALVVPAGAVEIRAVGAAASAYIHAGYQEVARAAEDQADHLAALCAAPDGEGLAEARSAFGPLVAAWGRIEMVRFGPVLTDNRFDRILFWPDRRSIGLRQVQGLLAEPDDSAIDVETLYDKSVALQGLGALEFVLFGTASEALATGEAPFRCAYGTTIAARIAETAQSVASDWAAPGGTGSQLAQPEPANEEFRDETDVLRSLSGMLIHNLEIIRDTRLMPVLGGGPDEARPRSALFWRSGMTPAILAANFASMRDFLDVSGLLELIEERDRWAQSALSFELSNLIAAIGRVDADMEVALASTEGRAAWDLVAVINSSLAEIMSGQVAGALGVTSGFSPNDGD